MEPAWRERIDRVLRETDFSGVVHVASPERVHYARACGFAERAHAVECTLDTRFAIASGTKGLTALAVMSLVADGVLSLDAPLDSLLDRTGGFAPAGVTVHQLLAHTSGIGDYLDEAVISDIEEYVLDVPVHRLACPADFRVVLGGRAPKFAPGARFAYCNSGYVLLALVVEAVSGRSYYEVVDERVCAPAGMSETSFLRLDELPGSAAVGYLPSRGFRVNTLHLPVRGAGDGGAYTTAADLARLWSALLAGRIVPAAIASEMLRPLHGAEGAARAYGLGFWSSKPARWVFLEGSDPGISFRSSCDPGTGLTCSVLSNTTRGAWPVIKELEASLSGA